MQELKESMVSDRKLSVRACDSCVRKRARWYCAADDAFLCDACDSSVHSANPLASRHERVRLKTASSPKENENEISYSFDDEDSEAGAPPPSWHDGFTRKARTPRRQKRNNNGKVMSNIIPLHLVPEQEVCSEGESEEQLLYRVPVFDPFEVENYGENTSNNNNTMRLAKSESDEIRREMSDLQGILLPSESDLAEFAADVESLLGKGLEEEAFDMEGLGIFDCDRDDVVAKECCLRIKTEDEEIGEAAVAADEGNHLLRIDLGRESFELNFDYASPFTYEEDEEENKAQLRYKDDSSKSLLKLDYERVMSAWDHKKSPWMSGERPEELSSGDWWPDCCLGTSGAMHAYGETATTRGDGGREARVSRYREKRRTRLFSKKIRYEVRKLNAEKRPRMKGRFVKRASFALNK